jgi:hypothetical protein
MPNINWNDAEAPKDFGVLPDGIYPAVVVNVKPGWTKAGDEMWNLTFEIMGGIYAGRKIFDNLVFKKGSCLGRVRQAFQAFGFATDGSSYVEIENIYGKECLINLETEEYNGKKKNIVTFANGYYHIDEGLSGGSVEIAGKEGAPF